VPWLIDPADYGGSSIAPGPATMKRGKPPLSADHRLRRPPDDLAAAVKALTTRFAGRDAKILTCFGRQGLEGPCCDTTPAGSVARRRRRRQGRPPPEPTPVQFRAGAAEGFG